MREFRRLAWRQRRIVLPELAVFSAWLVWRAWSAWDAHGRPDVDWSALRFILMIVLGGSLGVGLLLLLVAMTFPTFRHALGAVKFVILFEFVPLPEPYNVYTGLVLAMLLTGLLFDPRLDRWLPTIQRRTRQTFRTAVPPRMFFEAAVPGLGPPDRYFGPVWDVKEVPGQPNVRRIKYALGQGVFEEQTVTLDPQGPDRMAYDFVNDGSTTAAVQSAGRYVFELGPPDANGLRTVTLVKTRMAMPIRQAFLDWYGDESGSEADAIVAHAEGRRSLSTIARFIRSAKRSA